MTLSKHSARSMYAYATAKPEGKAIARLGRSKRAKVIRDWSAYQFFRTNAGGIVGESAKGALQLVKAERYTDQHGLEFVWSDDIDADFSFVDDWAERDRKEFNATSHEVYTCTLYRPCKDHGTDCRHAEVLASLSGIIDPSNDYRRIIQAELGLEAMPD